MKYVWIFIQPYAYTSMIESCIHHHFHLKMAMDCVTPRRFTFPYWQGCDVDQRKTLGRTIRHRTMSERKNEIRNEEEAYKSPTLIVFFIVTHG